MKQATKDLLDCRLGYGIAEYRSPLDDKLNTEALEASARIHLRVLTHQDAALILLLDQDVSPARIERWQRTDATDCGMLVDGEKACTIATVFADDKVTVTTTWHAPWDARIGT